MADNRYDGKSSQQTPDSADSHAPMSDSDSSNVKSQSILVSSDDLVGYTAPPFLTFTKPQAIVCLVVIIALCFTIFRLGGAVDSGSESLVVVPTKVGSSDKSLKIVYATPKPTASVLAKTNETTNGQQLAQNATKVATKTPTPQIPASAIKKAPFATDGGSSGSPASTDSQASVNSLPAQRASEIEPIDAEASETAVSAASQQPTDTFSPAASPTAPPPTRGARIPEESATPSPEAVGTEQIAVTPTETPAPTLTSTPIAPKATRTPTPQKPPTATRTARPATATPQAAPTKDPALYRFVVSKAGRKYYYCESDLSRVA